MTLDSNYTQTLKTKQCPRCSIFVDPSATVCPNDGTSLVERFDRDPVFANYEFLGEIGSGGMGVIYKARQVILNKIVAIKTLHPHLSSPEAFRRFQIEGKATSLLQHPFVVAVHDFGVTHSGQTFMVMDFIDGETLDALLRREGQLDEEHFLSIFIDVCEAMSHAHSRSVVHRDIKSSNIMIVKNQHGDEEIRIMDFGIAKLVADTESGASQVTRTGEVIGTATCMSPEQARGGKVDHRSDLYALGCVMYEALASCPPFAGNTPLETMLMHLEKRPISIKQASMGHTVDPRLEKIVFCLLEKEPDHRYQSMADLRQDLINLQKSMRSGAKAPPPLAPNMPKAKNSTIGRNQMLLVAVSAVAIVSVAFAVSTILSKSSADQTFVLGRSQSSDVASVRQEETSPRNSFTGDAKNIGSTVHAKSQPNVISMMKMLDADNLMKASIENQLHSNQVEVSVFNPGQVLVDKDMEAFRGSYPETKRVTISQAYGVTDVGLRNLSGLNLIEMNMSDSGARDLKLDWLLNQTDLKILNVSGAKLAPEAFVNIGKLKTLTQLKIDRTSFSDSDVNSIMGLSRLTLLNLSSTRVTLEGYDRLLNSLPNCADIRFAPARNNKGSYLLGANTPIDVRETAYILDEAKKAMTLSQWGKANLYLEIIILRSREKLDKRRTDFVNTACQLVACEAMRGDCLNKLKMPYAAMYMYNLAGHHIESYSIDPMCHADMLQRSAMVCESLPGPGALDKAIFYRGVAGNLSDKHPDIASNTRWLEFQKQNNLALETDNQRKTSRYRVR